MRNKISEIYTDSKLCKKRFIVRTAIKAVKSAGESGNIIQAIIPIITQKRTKATIPHSTNCWIYQLSGM